MNVPAKRTKEINDYRRRIAQTLDNIVQFRQRADMASYYGLYVVADRAEASIARLETDLERYRRALSRLGAE